MVLYETPSPAQTKKKRGRKPRDQFNLRLSDEMKAQLEYLAQVSQMSKSKVIESLIAEEYDETKKMASGEAESGVHHSGKDEPDNSGPDQSDNVGDRVHQETSEGQPTIPVREP